MSPVCAPRLIDRIEAATAAAKVRFGTADASVVIVGDAKQFLDELRALRPDVEVVRADALDLGGTRLAGR